MRTENQYRQLKTKERAQETRHKIQLGGLVIKAELESEPSAVLLGLLLEVAQKLKTAEADTLRDRWKVLGDLAFSKPSEG